MVIMTRRTPIFGRTIAPLFVAALFALIGCGQNVLIAAHAVLSHSDVVCTSGDEHTEPREQHPSDRKTDDCAICRSLILSHGVKCLPCIALQGLQIDVGAETLLISNFSAPSMHLFASRARDPPMSRA